MTYITKYQKLLNLFLNMCRGTLTEIILWDQAKGKYAAVNRRRPKYIISTLWAMVHCIFVSYRMWFVMKEEENAIIHMISVLVYIATGFGVLLGLIVIGKRQEIAEYFNAVLIFERRYGEKNGVVIRKKGLLGRVKYLVGKVQNEGMGNVVLSFLCLTSLFIPFGILCFLLVAPCKLVVQLRSTVDDCPDPWNYPFKIPQQIAFIATLLDEFYIAWIFGIGCAAIGIVFYLSVVFVRDILKGIEQKVETDLSTKEKVEESVKLYKSTQILMRLVNNINRGANAPTIILDVFAVAVTSTYSILALRSNMSLMLVLTVMLWSIDSGILVHVVMYGEIGDVHTISNNIRDSWKTNHKIQKDKYLRRLVKVADIKAQLGKSGNYIDKEFPLTMSQNTVDQTISLLLMT